jgi:thioesterase domain-containing protein
MTAQELGVYLHRHIPLSAAMQVVVERADMECVVLSAPLAPNLNHRETVFGGSAVSVAILSAWALAYLRVVSLDASVRFVIQRHEMQYDRPITGRFTASASVAATADWDRFLQTLARRNRARVALHSLLHQDESVVGRFVGEFVALRAEV